MITCPNCGQETSGARCQWCNYPLIRRRLVRLRGVSKVRKAPEVEKQAIIEAEIAAQRKARQEAEEARKAREAEKQAKKEAEIAALKKARQEAEEARRVQETKKEIEEAIKGISNERYRKEIEPLLSLPIDRDQMKQLEEYLEEIESIWGELKAGKIGTEEAIQRLRDTSKRVS